MLRLGIQPLLASARQGQGVEGQGQGQVQEQRAGAGQEEGGQGRGMGARSQGSPALPGPSQEKTQPVSHMCFIERHRTHRASAQRGKGGPQSRGR